MTSCYQEAEFNTVFIGMVERETTVINKFHLLIFIIVIPEHLTNSHIVKSETRFLNHRKRSMTS